MRTLERAVVETVLPLVPVGEELLFVSVREHSVMGKEGLVPAEWLEYATWKIPEDPTSTFTRKQSWPWLIRVLVNGRFQHHRYE